MAYIFIYNGVNYSKVEVTEEFAIQYKEMEHKERLINRKETRRHQSLDKMREGGYDFCDLSANVFLEVQRNEDKIILDKALNLLTGMQREIVIFHIYYEMSFREIAREMNLNKDTVREHYLAALRKMKKFLNNTPPNYIT